jgi:hypothetical protein
MEPWVVIVLVVLVLWWRVPPLWRGLRRSSRRSSAESAERENLRESNPTTRRQL